MKDPDQRIDLEDVKRHPWMQQMLQLQARSAPGVCLALCRLRSCVLCVQSMRPSAEQIRHEMALRAPPAREIAGDQVRLARAYLPSLPAQL